MKPWQKIAVALVATAAFFSALAIIALIALLPEPATIGRTLQRSAKSSHIATTPPATSVVSPGASATKAAPPSSNSGAPTSATPAPSPVPAAERKRLVTEAFIERYLSDDRMQSRVCDNLSQSPPPFKSAEEFGKQLENSLLGESKPSATAEAVMLPVEYTLKNEAVRELVRTAQDAAARGNTGFLHKAQFYALAARATASVLGSREELEAISSNAYRLYAMSRAVALKPEILADPDLGDLCRGFERSALDGIAHNDNMDRDRLNRLFERHGITNESIDYDPNVSTRIQLVQDGGNFQIKLPWLERVFKRQ